MSFNRDYFTPVFISGVKSPRLFVYASEEDPLSEIMEPGYFNSQRIMLLTNSMIKVVAKDQIAEIIVAKREGLNVTMRPDYFRATDPYKDMTKSTRKRRTPAQIKADKKKAAEEAEEAAKLAATG